MKRSQSEPRGRLTAVVPHLRTYVTFLLVLILCATGCSKSIRVGMDQYPPVGTKRTKVTTRDGFVYDFSKTHVYGDSLVGAYSIVEERVTSDGHFAYVEVPHYEHLPLSNIAFVEYKEFDYAGAALIGAGAAIVVVFVAGLDDGINATKLSDGDGSGTGKPNYPPPE